MTLTSGDPPIREQIQNDLQNGKFKREWNHDFSVKFPFWGFGVFKRYDDDDYDNQL